jgi:AmiR/NasT family two-component response regulator
LPIVRPASSAQSLVDPSVPSARKPKTEDLPRSLRILIANERKDRLGRIAEIVTGLGHEVISRELEVSEVAAATEREHPDLAFVGLGVSGEHALDMISEIVREASCPVIALLEADDPVWVNEAAKRGIFAYIVDSRAEEMQSAIDITLRRYAEYASLEGAFARRAVIERTKGIMMSRHEIDERRAFELLRSQSQRSGRKVCDVAEAVIESHLLLVLHERSL